jgi:hypothetical protein
MAMSHRTIHRGILMTALLGLTLGGCSFSYSSGSSASPNQGSSGKSVSHARAHANSGSGDNHGKPISRSGGSGSGKSISKGDNTPDDPPTRANADDDDPPTRTPTADPPKRTKVPPKRTKVPATRTPSTEDDTNVQSGTSTSPASSNTIRAKTKVTPPPTASDNLVAPH